MKTKQSVSFRNNSRIHFGLIVTDLQKSIDFYRTLFQEEPRKVKKDYAKFELDDPSINLALDLRDQSTKRETAVTHFGIQVKDQEAIVAAANRLNAAGWKTEEEANTICCYAEQSKVWAVDPDGNKWEIFLVTDYDSELKSDNENFCCSASEESENAPCC